MSVKSYLDAFLTEKYRTALFTHPHEIGPHPDLTLTKMLTLSPRQNYLAELSSDPILNRLYVTVRNGARKYAEPALTYQTIAERSNVRPLVITVIPERLSSSAFTPSTEIMVATAIFIVYKDRIYTATNFGATRDINLLLGIYHEFYSIAPSAGPSNFGDETCTINIPNTKLDLVFKRDSYEAVLRKCTHSV